MDMTRPTEVVLCVRRMGVWTVNIGQESSRNRNLSTNIYESNSPSGRVREETPAMTGKDVRESVTPLMLVARMAR